MTIINQTSTTKPAKKAYKKPKLAKHGKVTRITLKTGSAVDMMTGANDFQR